MLNQKFPIRTGRANRRYELARYVELVIAREDQRLDLLLAVARRDEVAADDPEPCVALPHFFPEIRGAMTVRVKWIAGAALIAFVERQEVRLRAFQSRRHAHFALTHGEVNKRAAREIE